MIYRFELNIDWEQLRHQKLLLLRMLQDERFRDDPLWGIVHLLDEIQDQAVSLNAVPDAVVFGALEDEQV